MNNLNFFQVFKPYFRFIILKVLGLGFISGLPLALTAGTMQAKLTDEAVSLKVISGIMLVSLPYAFKFVWAPLLDQLYIPFLTNKFGRRKSIILIIQLLLAGCIYITGSINSIRYINLFINCVALMAFLSASQDILIDALRIEMLKDDDQGLGAAVATLGYRFGMLVSGAGALYAADVCGWKYTYRMLAYLMVSSIIITLSCRENEAVFTRSGNYLLWVKKSFYEPVKDFVSRKNWLCILFFIITFKMTDAFVGNMTTPFLLQLGFSKSQIASVVKLFGLISTLLGSIVGGILIKKVGYYNSLFWSIIMQATSNFVFIVQKLVGVDVKVLMLNISVENFAGGIGTAAFVAYISHLCNKKFTASQYAILSALAVFARVLLASPAGIIVELVGWIPFFIISSVFSFPAVYMLRKLKKGVDV